MAQGALYRQYAAYVQKASAFYQPPQMRASLEVILSVFTVSLLILFAVRPTLTNIATLQKKIEDQEAVVKKADIKLGQLLKAEGQLSENMDRLFLYTVAVPDTFDYFNISKRIEIVARESQVRLNSIKLPGSIVMGGPKISGLPSGSVLNIASPDKAGLTSIPVTFSIVGSQAQVIGFLRAIENMDLFSVIQTIKISRHNVATGQTISGLVLDGTATFYSIIPDR